MNYQGFGIRTMNSQQKPRKVFQSRFENKGMDISLKGALTLQKVEWPKVEPQAEVYRPSILVAIEAFAWSIFNRGTLINLN